MNEFKKEKLYVVNPDVVLREEDDDGALLFNPDTNDVKVINQTGLCIWNACNKASNLAEIIKAVKTDFDQVPDEKIESETKAFVDALIQSEFIGKA